MLTTPIQFREHKSYSGNTIFAEFNKPTSSVVRAATTSASIGDVYIFFVVNRVYIDGKYIRFNWSGEVTPTPWVYSMDTDVIIMDGEYDRTDNTDFPSGGGILIKGGGLLQTLVHKEGDVTWTNETQDVQIDVSGGSQTNVTIMFKIHDAQSNWNIEESIDWIEINSSAGGSGNLYAESMTGELVLELEDTEGDYAVLSGEVIDSSLSSVYSSIAQLYSQLSINFLLVNIILILSTLSYTVNNILHLAMSFVYSLFRLVSSTLSLIWETFVELFFIRTVTTNIPYVIRTGANAIQLRVDFYDEDDNDANTYEATFWCREPDNLTIHGPYDGVIAKEEAKEYNATYSLNPADVWTLGKYDVRVKVTK